MPENAVITGVLFGTMSASDCSDSAGAGGSSPGPLFDSSPLPDVGVRARETEPPARPRALPAQNAAGSITAPKLIRPVQGDVIEVGVEPPPDITLRSEPAWSAGLANVTCYCSGNSQKPTLAWYPGAN